MEKDLQKQLQAEMMCNYKTLIKVTKYIKFLEGK